MPTSVVAAALPVAGQVIGSAFGGNQGTSTPALPRDLGPMRQNNINLLQYLLGFGGQGGSSGGGQPAGGGGMPSPWGGTFNNGGILGRGGSSAGVPAPNMDPASFGGQGGGPQNRLESFFGPLVNQTANNKYLGGIDQTLGALQSIINSKPGQGVIDALQPGYERNLALANQQGGRFGSSNAILHSRALDDYSLLAANAAQQGQQTQLQAGNLQGILSQMGVNISDMANQRTIALLQGLLGTSQNATLGGPVNQTPSGANQGAAVGGSLAQILTALQTSGAMNGGAGGMTGGAGGSNFGGSQPWWQMPANRNAF